MTGGPPLLETERLSKRFGGLQAVRDVSIALGLGELHAVIGPNGAGKSTLVNLLAGELEPTSGVIRLDGQDVTGARVWRMARLGIGRSFQRTNLFLPLSVHENARLAAQGTAGSGNAGAGAGDAAMGALQRVGLAWAATMPAARLSHGAQRQLEIAMALAGGARVLLLDEPMAGMGPEESQRIATLLRKLAEDHAILLIEHDMDFVFAVADRLTVMVEGQVLATGRPEAIRANPDVQRAYLGGHA